MFNRTLLSGITLALLLGKDVSGQTVVPSETEVAVASVVQEIDKALGLIKTGIDDGLTLPPLKSATLNLQTTVSKKGGGGFNFLIFTFGKTWTKEQSQTLQIVLVPAPTVKIGTSSISETLVQAVLSAARGLSESGSSLRMKSSSIELSFVVKADSTLGGKFTIAPIDFNFSGNLTKTAIHKVTLLFEAPAPASAIQ